MAIVRSMCLAVTNQGAFVAAVDELAIVREQVADGRHEAASGICFIAFGSFSDIRDVGLDALSRGG